MSKPVLSICIPTKNRASILNQILYQITSDDIFIDTNKIEVIVSDNCSNDNTQDICLKYKEKFPNKFIYVRREEDIHDKNFTEILKCANGKYAKLNNDNLYYRNGSLIKIVEILEKIDKDAIFISNSDTKDGCAELLDFKNFDEFLNYATYKPTWIGGLCVNTQKYLGIDAPDRFSHLNFAQIDIFARLSASGNIAVLNGNFMDQVNLYKKGGYNIAEVFGERLFTVLQSLLKEGYLTKSTYNRVIKKTLLKHINYYYFDYDNNFSFEKGGYFKYLFKYYKFKPYYYFNYLIHLFKLLTRMFCKIEKTDKHIIMVIFSFIKLKVKRKFDYKKNWIKKNKHNHTWLVNSIQSEKITVGEATYGPIDAVFSSNNGDEKLIIGNFCSIAPNVKFIISSEHPYYGLSTYPFKVYYLGHKFESSSKGSIVVKDDVWIGLNSIILSGVTIGQGAIIGAGSVVTKNVPPYAIVGGNPAKILKYRFEPEIIEKLIKFDFSKLTEEKIKQLGFCLYTKITSGNVDNLLEEFSSNV